MAHSKKYAINEVRVVPLEMHNKGMHCAPMVVWYIMNLKMNLIYVRSLKL